MVATPHELVGRTDKQTLKRKTLVSPTITGDITVTGGKFIGEGAAPTGAMWMWPTVGPPTGWLLCDGTAVSRTTYAALFALVGTTYGAGDGSTTFNLPDLTNRFPRQAVPGTTGGAATHTHTFDDGGHAHTSANHSHTLSSAGQAQILIGPTGTAAASLNVATPSWTGGANMSGTAGVTAAHTTGAALAGATDSTTPGGTGTTNSTGTTASGSSLPPYLGVSFIIKV